MLSYPAAIPLSHRTLVELSDLLRQRRNQLRCRWRRLDPGRQALLVLAHLPRRRHLRPARGGVRRVPHHGLALRPRGR